MEGLTQSEIIIQNEFLNGTRCRPLVNFLLLCHVMYYKQNAYSFLMRSCFFFCYKVFTDHDMFKYIFNLEPHHRLPWDIPTNRQFWIHQTLLSPEDHILEERTLKMWFKLLSQWYDVFFKNPNWHIQWSINDGYGFYHSTNGLDIEEMLNNELNERRTTFLEPVEDEEAFFFEECKFGSIFQYKGKKYILYGFWMMCNSNKITNPYNPIGFKHLYEIQSSNDPDSIIGKPFRTMVEWFRRVTTTASNIEVYLYYNKYK
jgi:hypothetical protein